MDPKTVLSKSAKGREEIETRKHKLEQRLRVVLITINGKLSAAELAKQFSNMSDIQAVLEKLVRDDFAQPALDPAARLKQARAEIAALISSSFGPDGDALALKVEAAETLEDVRAYLESRRAVLDGVLGNDKAAAFWTKATALLA